MLYAKVMVGIVGFILFGSVLYFFFTEKEPDYRKTLGTTWLMVAYSYFINFLF